MSPQRKKVFTSPRDVFETYFPNSADKKRICQTGPYDKPHSDVADRLAERFAASIAKKPRQ